MIIEIIVKPKQKRKLCHRNVHCQNQVYKTVKIPLHVPDSAAYSVFYMTLDCHFSFTFSCLLLTA